MLFLRISNEQIVDYGLMRNLDLSAETNEIYDAKEAFVLPTWCHSHTHFVMQEVEKMNLLQKLKRDCYEEIARNGGGILNSRRKLDETSEDELF